MQERRKVFVVMSQDFTQPKTRQTHHILIIDDSARLRQTLADLIVANCLATGKIFKVFHSDKDGKFTQSKEVPGPEMFPLDGIIPTESSVIDEFTIYTAPSPRQALFVINSPVFSRLTIISDVMMPADTEVGLIGMLEAIARRNLPVNLVFASSDAQNSFVVAKLVETGKAYFLVKQGRAWEELSKALVHRADAFRFKIITSLDFEGMQKIAGLAMRAGSQTAPLTEPAKPAGFTVPPSSALPSLSPALASFQRPRINPLRNVSRPPRNESIQPPNRLQPSEATRLPSQPLRQEAPRTPGQHIQDEKPELPLAPNPVLKKVQPPAFNQALRSAISETPQIEGFVPVTPTPPPAKTAVPPMPVWEEPVAPENREPQRIPAVPVAHPAARPQAPAALPDATNTVPPASTSVSASSSPGQTQTPLSRYADTREPKAKPVFLLFRPFVALLKAWKNR